MKETWKENNGENVGVEPAAVLFSNASDAFRKAVVENFVATEVRPDHAGSKRGEFTDITNRSKNAGLTSGGSPIAKQQRQVHNTVSRESRGKGKVKEKQLAQHTPGVNFYSNNLFEALEVEESLIEVEPEEPRDETLPVLPVLPQGTDQQEADTDQLMLVNSEDEDTTEALPNSAESGKDKRKRDSSNKILEETAHLPGPDTSLHNSHGTDQTSGGVATTS
ncbi:hypothetical protein R1sor_008850 [Riccia sorocarpa]|uniref:Uncharacterized protein n=1 Tax=Riccia sorocarpa TaxID=122646 RepID=A0ABD3H829_9MARC